MTTQLMHHDKPKLAAIPVLADGPLQQNHTRISRTRSLVNAAAVIFGSSRKEPGREFLAKNRQTGGE
jgi:hypothetical protein